MASPNIIDIDALSQAISKDHPVGTDIREDRSANSEYYSIKDARNGARAAERANLFDDDDGVDTLSMWKPVIDIAPKILGNSSKDLEVLCWYIEALIRFYGFAGLRDGLTLTREIVEKYWDGVYPLLDEDGLETKVAALTGLNGDGSEGTLLSPIRNCVITTDGNTGAFSYWQYQQAKDANKLSDESSKASRYESMGFNLQSIEATIAKGNTDFYVDLVDDLEECNRQFQLLSDLLIGHCASQAPPTSNIRGLLDEVTRAVRFLTKDKLAHLKIKTAHTTEDETPMTNCGSTRSAMDTTGPIANREDALNRLQEVASYFRLYEPHTPLSPAIERIVKWGRMNVADLMMELVPDITSRAILSQLTGVKLDGSDVREYVAPPSNYSNDDDSNEFATSGSDQQSEPDNNDVSW